MLETNWHRIAAKPLTYVGQDSTQGRWTAVQSTTKGCGDRGADFADCDSWIEVEADPVRAKVGFRGNGGREPVRIGQGTTAAQLDPNRDGPLGEPPVVASGEARRDVEGGLAPAAFGDCSVLQGIPRDVPIG